MEIYPNYITTISTTMEKILTTKRQSLNKTSKTTDDRQAFKISHMATGLTIETEVNNSHAFWLLLMFIGIICLIQVLSCYFWRIRRLRKKEKKKHVPSTCRDQNIHSVEIPFFSMTSVDMEQPIPFIIQPETNSTV